MSEVSISRYAGPELGGVGVFLSPFVWNRARFLYCLRHVSRSSCEVGVWGLGRGPLHLPLSHFPFPISTKLGVAVAGAVAGAVAVDRTQDDRIMQMEQVCKVSAHGHRQPFAHQQKLTQTARSERLGT